MSQNDANTPNSNIYTTSVVPLVSDLPDSDQEWVKYISTPREYEHTEHARVRSNFVGNGDTDGIGKIPWEGRLEKFTFDIKGPSEGPKFSTQYADCTGIAIRGVPTDGGMPLSVMSHQSPPGALENEEEFRAALTASCQEIRSRCEPENIKLDIFGGRDGLSDFAQSELVEIFGDPKDKHFNQKINDFCLSDGLQGIGPRMIEIAHAGGDYFEPLIARLRENYERVVAIIQDVFQQQFPDTECETHPAMRGTRNQNAYLNTQQANLCIIRPEDGSQSGDLRKIVSSKVKT